MVTDVVILGATAYHEISELISDINNAGDDKIRVVALLDDSKDLHGSFIAGVRVIGSLDMVSTFDAHTKFVFAIGSHRTFLLRKKILTRIGLSRDRFINLIHPQAKVFSTARIGQGVIIHFGSIIFNNSIVSDFTMIMAMAVVGAHNVIGEGCCITSQVVTTNNVRIGSYSFIGTNSSIAENVEVAPGNLVGMNTLIARDTEVGEVKFGVPAKRIDLKNVDQDIIDTWENQKEQWKN